MSSAGDLIPLEVAYALPHEQFSERLWVRPGTTAGQALQQSSVLTRYPELVGKQPAIGIFGKPVPHDHVVEAGDRIEIYRALINDPKQARRLRARHGRG